MPFLTTGSIEFPFRTPEPKGGLWQRYRYTGRPLASTQRPSDGSESAKTKPRRMAGLSVGGVGWEHQGDVPQ